MHSHSTKTLENRYTCVIYSRWHVGGDGVQEAELEHMSTDTILFVCISKPKSHLYSTSSPKSNDVLLVIAWPFVTAGGGPHVTAANNIQ